jgi:hypothetical protein
MNVSNTGLLALYKTVSSLFKVTIHIERDSPMEILEAFFSSPSKVLIQNVEALSTRTCFKRRLSKRHLPAEVQCFENWVISCKMGRCPLLSILYIIRSRKSIKHSRNISSSLKTCSSLALMSSKHTNVVNHSPISAIHEDLTHIEEVQEPTSSRGGSGL